MPSPIWPTRESIAGICVYYLTVIAVVITGVSAWLNPTIWLILLALFFLLLLIAQDVIWYKHCYFTNQDRRLIEKLSDKLQDQGIQHLITDHDFRCCSFSTLTLEPLQDIIRDWVGVDYEFVNPNYQALWESLRKSLDHFLTFLMQESKNSNAYVRYIPSEEGEETGGRDVGKEANLAAAQVYQLFQQFRAIYIQKMPYIN